MTFAFPSCQCYSNKATSVIQNDIQRTSGTGSLRALDVFYALFIIKCDYLFRSIEIELLSTHFCMVELSSEVYVLMCIASEVEFNSTGKCPLPGTMKEGIEN